jgi:hypothetical protein
MSPCVVFLWMYIGSIFLKYLPKYIVIEMVYMFLIITIASIKYPKAFLKSMYNI